MSLNLSRADEGPITFTEEVVLTVDDLDPDQVAGPVKVRLEGRVLAVADGYMVEGTAAAEGPLACSRCLCPVPWSGGESFAIELRHPPGGGDDEVELKEADLDVVFIADDTLDLRELAAEQVLLTLPMKILCRPDCAGLCGRCGANLNEGSCQCEPESDPRWEALRGLGGSSS